MRRTPLDPIQLRSNRFSNNQPTLLAMSSVRVTPGSRSVFVADNGVNTITRFHWGRGPMEMGVYMLGTFQALSQCSSNVPTRYISFTFQM